jgi:hypothetical protein
MAIPDDVVAFDHTEYPDLDIGGGTGIPVECTQLGMVIPKGRDLHNSQGYELWPEYSFNIIFYPHVIDTLVKYAILGEKKSIDREFNKERCDGIYLIIQYFQEEHTVSCLKDAYNESILIQYDKRIVMVFILCLRGAHNAQEKNKQYARFFLDEANIRSDGSFRVKGNF